LWEKGLGDEGYSIITVVNNVVGSISFCKGAVWLRLTKQPRKCELIGFSMDFFEEWCDQGEDPHPQPLSQGGRGEPDQEIDQGDYWEVSLSLKQKMTGVARQFRREPTVSENILWQAIRGHKLDGRRFRRQQPIGVFVVDFLCSSERLIVEVDGSVHDFQQERDQQRQNFLESLNFTVVRITNEQVEKHLDSALASIRQAFNSTSSIIK
jgi:very-short-patch-repair endonuclease